MLNFGSSGGNLMRFRPPRQLNQSFPAPKLQAPKNPLVVAPKQQPINNTPATSTDFRPMPAVRGALSFGNIAYPGQRGVFKPKASKPVSI